MFYFYIVLYQKLNNAWQVSQGGSTFNQAEFSYRLTNGNKLDNYFVSHLLFDIYNEKQSMSISKGWYDMILYVTRKSITDNLVRISA